MKNGKIWGFTEAIFDKGNVEINRIEIDAGGYCSKHLHKHKHNIFYVESGELKVTVWKNDYDLVDITYLRDGEMTDVSPNEYHRFKASVKTIVYEIYYVELSSDDIVRNDCGGNDS